MYVPSLAIVPTSVQACFKLGYSPVSPVRIKVGTRVILYLLSKALPAADFESNTLGVVLIPKLFFKIVSCWVTS